MSATQQPLAELGSPPAILLPSDAGRYHGDNTPGSVSASTYLDDISNTSHASSSRIPMGSSVVHGAVAAQARGMQYQPLSLADILTRSGQDQVRALDQLLAERNKLCLEVTKLSTENMRLWNMMKRIKRENDGAGGLVGSPSTSQLRGSPYSAATSLHSNNPHTSSSSLTAASLAAATTLTSSSTAPALAYKTPGTQTTGTPEHAASALANPLSRRDLGGNSSLPSSTDHLTVGGESDDVEPRVSLSASSDTRSHSSPSTSSIGQTNAVRSHSLPDTTPLGKAALVAQERAARMDMPPFPHNMSPASHQQASIMQQRAAAQAQRLAQIQQEASSGTRPESQDFDAVDGSSLAPSEDRSSTRASTEIAPKHNAQPAFSRGGSGAPGSPLTTSSPSQTDYKRWSTESPRNSLSPRLDSSLLQFCNLTVSGSNFRSNSNGTREITSFYVSVEVRSPPGKNLSVASWRVEKTLSDIATLDGRLRHKHGKVMARNMAGIQLPDASLFKDHAPSKVDKRKSMLEAYLRAIVATPLADKVDLCTFLCTDAIPPLVRDPEALTKEGFLTKKGQNLGRWVTRWYSLTDTLLNHFESRGGLHLGSIDIRGGQIGRQQKSAATDSDENSYRHAFLILESRPPAAPKEQKQVIRHVLCAESDEERDDWVDVLVRAIGEADMRDRAAEEAETGESVGASAHSAISNSQSAFMISGRSQPRGEDDSDGSRTIEKRGSANSSMGSHATGSLAHLRNTTAMPPPLRIPDSASNFVGTGLASPSSSNIPRSKSELVGLPGYGYRDARAMSDAGKIVSPTLPSAMSPTTSRSRPPPRSTSQDVGGNAGASSSSVGHGMSYDAAERQSRASKDRPRPSISGPMNGTPIPTGYKFGSEPGATRDSAETKRRFWKRFGAEKGVAKKVFGVPLAQSIAVSNVSEGLALPSVVYRCIEYLEKKRAASEEGIYRLSGSSAVIKNLKSRFDAHGDVNLLAADESEYDVHAIAGLLKQYLRELPEGLLTHELHLDFMRVIDVGDRRERVNELGSLVSMLPLANYSLLRTLCSHLIKVIENAEVNKMTMRNVGIVFSPTLGIPAGVFALFLTEFDWVFNTDVKGEPAPRAMDEDILPPDAEELGMASPTAISFGERPRRSNVNRSTRNSLYYDESEADKLLGGPQAKNRLSTYHEDTMVDNGQDYAIAEQEAEILAHELRE